MKLTELKKLISECLEEMDRDAMESMYEDKKSNNIQTFRELDGIDPNVSYEITIELFDPEWTQYTKGDHPREYGSDLERVNALITSITKDVGGVHGNEVKETGQLKDFPDIKFPNEPIRIKVGDYAGDYFDEDGLKQDFLDDYEPTNLSDDDYPEDEEK